MQTVRGSSMLDSIPLSAPNASVRLAPTGILRQPTAPVARQLPMLTPHPTGHWTPATVNVRTFGIDDSSNVCCHAATFRRLSPKKMTVLVGASQATSGAQLLLPASLTQPPTKFACHSTIAKPFHDQVSPASRDS